MKNLFALISFGLLLAAIGISCQVSNPITKRVQLRMIKPSAMIPASNQSYYEEIRMSKRCTDKAINDYVEQITDKLIKATTQYYEIIQQAHVLKDFQWEVVVLDAPEVVNATCRPGGKIVVYTGILPIADNEDGLAAIIGHEIGHALANHSAERASQRLAAQYLGTGVNILIGDMRPEDQNLILDLYAVGTHLGYILPFSRKHETEADEIGLMLMTLAGFNPNEAPEIWLRMERMVGGSGSAFFSTHPSNKQRYSRQKQHIPAARLFAYTYARQNKPVGVAGNNTVVNAGKEIRYSTPTINAQGQFTFLSEGQDKYGEGLSFRSTAPRKIGTMFRIQAQIIPHDKTKDPKIRQLNTLGPVFFEYINSKNMYRVLVGELKTRDEALLMACRVKQLGFSNVFIEQYKDGNRTTESYFTGICKSP